MDKSMRRFRSSRRDDGVSEVVATMLLLSITVVIAATIWFWMADFVPTDKGRAPALTMYVDASDAGTGYVYVFVKSVSMTVGVSDVDYTIYDSNGVAVERGSLTDDEVYGGLPDAVNDRVATYMDGDHNGLLSAGDFFVLNVDRYGDAVNGGSIGLMYIQTNTLMGRQNIRF